MPRKAPDPGMLDFSRIKSRALTTLLVLLAYRALAAVYLPWIDLDAVFGRSGAVDLFSGGTLGRSSVLGLGILPYLLARLILQFRLGEPPKDGTALRLWTLAFALIEASAVAWAWPRIAGGAVAWPYYATTILTLSAGAMAVAWMAERINEKGIGNGAAWIVVSGVVAQIWGAWGRFRHEAYIEEAALHWVVAHYLLAALVVLAAIILLTGQRKVMIQYSKRVVGRRLMGGMNAPLPIRLEASGGMALIYAAGLLAGIQVLSLFALDIAPVAAFSAALKPGSLGFQMLLIPFAVALAYALSATNPQLTEAVDNVQKMGGFMAGLRSGDPTRRRIQQISKRLSLSGGLLAGVLAALFPDVASLAVVVLIGAAMETMGQIEGHLMLGGSAAANKGVSHKTARRGR